MTEQDITVTKPTVVITNGKLTDSNETENRYEGESVSAYVQRIYRAGRALADSIMLHDDLLYTETREYKFTILLYSPYISAIGKVALGATRKMTGGSLEPITVRRLLVQELHSGVGEVVGEFEKFLNGELTP